MKILGSNGFVDFEGFKQTGIKQSIKINFSDGSNFICSENHALKINNGEWSLAKELIIGDELNGKIITDLKQIGEVQTYSPINVGTDFTYYSSGFYSHNCAFVDNWDSFFASVFPTISSGDTTKILLTSTPNGLNHFYHTCEGAKEEKNGYQYVEVPWWLVPGRDEAWKQETLAAMDFDYEKFAQEFCCEFQGSSGTLISGAALKSLVAKIPLSSKDGLTRYEEGNPDNTYVIIADVSRGKGLDYSAFHVIDVTKMPYKQVCVYRNNMVTPLDYASTLYSTSKAYNKCAILVELNDIGGQVADSLFYDYDCETILYTESAGARGKRLTAGFTKGSTDRGIRTTKTVKAVGCSMLKLLIEQQQLVINDQNTIYELSRFSKKGSSYQAEKGCTDDLVMGLVLFAWMTDQQYFRELTDINTLMQLREKTDEELKDDMFDFYVDAGEVSDPDEIIDLTEHPNSEYQFF